MKKSLKINAFISLFSLFLATPQLIADSKLAYLDSQPDISMDFKDAELKDILKVFSIQSGLNFIASEGVQDRKITLYLDKVPLQQAMNELFKANNLSYELNEESNIFTVKDWGKLQTETVTKVFYLKYATVSSSSLKQEMANELSSSTTSFTVGSTESSSSSASSTGGKWKAEEEAGITTAVKKLLSKDGSVIEDFRTNSLIVTDTPNRVAIISQVIAALDVRVPQVLLEVEMLDVSKNVVDKLGFNYGTSPFTAVLTGASVSTGFPFKGWGKMFTTENTLGSLAMNTGSNTYTVTLDYLRSQTDTKFLARPRLLTLNNETAEIRIATNESIGLVTTTASTGGSSGSTTQEAERTETGVILRVTPQINAELGEITMFVYPKVAEAVAGQAFTSGTSGTFQFRDPEERSTKSIVRIKDGETVVIGGLIRNELLRQETKLPILGDLPWIGGLFRHVGGTSSSPDKNKQRELLVFITPHIVKDATNIEIAQAKKTALPLLPLREQNTDSGLSRETAISSVLNNFERKK